MSTEKLNKNCGSYEDKNGLCADVTGRPATATVNSPGRLSEIGRSGNSEGLNSAMIAQT
jgi:hypothetical protein